VYLDRRNAAPKTSDIKIVSIETNQYTIDDPLLSVEWNQTWGLDDIDISDDIWVNDSFIYTVGFTSNGNGSEQSALLVKWGIDGSLIWNRSADFYGYDAYNGIWCDGNYLYTAGNLENSSDSTTDILLVKWDSDGNQLWNRTWNNGNYEYAFNIWGYTSDLYVVGYTVDSTFLGGDLLLMKWNTDGDLIWNRTWQWDYSSGSGGLDVWCNSSVIYTAGYSTYNVTGKTDALLVKWDPNGSVVEFGIWGDTQVDEWCEGLKVGDDYIFTVGTYYNASSSNSYDLLLLEWSFDNSVARYSTWDFGGSEHGYDIWVSNESIYTVGTFQAGSSSRGIDNNEFTSDINLKNINPSGAINTDAILIQWNRECEIEDNATWGTGGLDEWNGIWVEDGLTLEGEHIYVAGYTTGFSNDSIEDLLLMKYLKDLYPLAGFGTPDAELVENEQIDFVFYGSLGNKPTEFQWNFDDSPFNSTDVNASHQYSHAGNYTVTLTLTDADGDSSTASQEFTILAESPNQGPSNDIPGYMVHLLLVITVIMVISIVFNRLQERKISFYHG